MLAGDARETASEDAGSPTIAGVGTRATDFKHMSPVLWASETLLEGSDNGMGCLSVGVLPEYKNPSPGTITSTIALATMIKA